eukprot:jgi/Chlat1/9159/Chrsp97S08444
MEAAAAAKGKEAAALLKKADKASSLSLTRWTPDWAEAAPLYERAAALFRAAKDLPAARAAHEKAAHAHERLKSPYTAAGQLESAASIAASSTSTFSSSTDSTASELARRAAELFREAGRGERAADTLARTGKAVLDNDPAEAVLLLLDACEAYEEEGKEGQATEAFQACVRALLKLGRSSEAAAVLLRHGLACQRANATASQCRAYLSAVVVWLSTGDVRQAELGFNDVADIPAFASSEQCIAAERLIDAYKEGDKEAVKKIVATTPAFNYLDHHITALAKKLPIGDIAKQEVSTLGDGVDENDLT